MSALMACGGGGGGKRRAADGDGGDAPGPPPIDSTGVPQFTADSFVVDESAGTATVTLSRFGPVDNEISTFVNVVGGDGARDGVDFVFSTTQVRFAAGDTAPKTITVNITNDQFDERDEVINLSLPSFSSRTVNGVTTASRDRATLTIRDDDSFASAQFTRDSLLVDETAGIASLNLTRLGTGLDEITATVTVTGGTATPGRDFENTKSQSVVFPAGSDAPVAVSFDIFDDLLAENTETIALSLQVTGAGGVVPPQEQGQSSTIAIVDNNDAQRSNVQLSVVSTEPKALVLKFGSVLGATRYRLMRGLSGLPMQQVGDDLPGSATEVRAVVPLHLGEVLRLDPCDALECQPSRALLAPSLLATVAATGYLKASDTAAGQRLGSVVAISDDGSTIALGAPDAAGGAGAVYVYRRRAGSDSALDSTPTRIAAPTSTPIRFGAALALNSSGSMLVIGAPDDSNTARGEANRYPAVGSENQAAPRSGAAFLYELPSASTMPASLTYRYLKARRPMANDGFGSAVAIVLDNTNVTLLVGAPGDDSDNAIDSGAVHEVTVLGDSVSSSVFKASDGLGSDVQAGANFGASLAVSADSNLRQTLVAGAPRQQVFGSDGLQVDSGAAYVYKFIANTLAGSTATRIQAQSPKSADRFGAAVAVSRDGTTIAVGAPSADVPFTEAGRGTNPGQDAGAVFIFATASVSPNARRNTAFFTSRPAAGETRFGSSVALSADGSILAVGIPRDSSALLGVTMVPSTASDAAPGAGAVAVLRRLDPDWRAFTNPRGTQPVTRYVKASNADAGDLFGAAVALSGDAGTLVVGAPGESGNGTNFDAVNRPFDSTSNQLMIDPKQSDNSASQAGAAYLY